MYNLAVGVSGSQVEKSCYVVSAEAFLMVTTVISIQVKAAAHFTELSAPLTVHHDLLFPSMSLQLSVVSLTVMVLMNKKHKGGRGVDRNFPVASAHKQTCGKVMKRLLIKSKS